MPKVMADSKWKEKRKTSAKCHGCDKVTHGTHNTTSNDVSLTKTAHKNCCVCVVSQCMCLSLTNLTKLHSFISC